MLEVHYYTSEDPKRPGYYICLCGAVAAATRVTRNTSRVTCNRCKYALGKK